MKFIKVAVLFASAVLSSAASVLASAGFLFINNCLIFLLVAFCLVVLLMHELLNIFAASGRSLGLVSAIRKYGAWISQLCFGRAQLIPARLCSKQSPSTAAGSVLRRLFLFRYAGWPLPVQHRICVLFSQGIAACKIKHRPAIMESKAVHIYE